MISFDQLAAVSALFTILAFGIGYCLGAVRERAKRAAVMDEIVLSERDYKRLLESRNAFASTLAALTELGSQEAQEGDQAAERKRILSVAETQLDWYGQHQAFVVV